MTKPFLSMHLDQEGEPTPVAFAGFDVNEDGNPDILNFPTIPPIVWEAGAWLAGSALVGYFGRRHTNVVRAAMLSSTLAVMHLANGIDEMQTRHPDSYSPTLASSVLQSIENAVIEVNGRLLDPN